MRLRKTRIAVLVLTTGLSGAAQAALYDRGGGLVFDDDLGVTWLQDANYAQTSGHDADGEMSWGSAVTWASSLNYYDSIRNVTYTDWRLPKVSPVDGVSFNNIFRNDGSTDAGFNISAEGTLYARSTASEMAYMFYQNLGNPGFFKPDNTDSYCAPNCIQNTGLFVNLGNVVYWAGTEYDYDTSQAWIFAMSTGLQGAGYKEHENNRFFAWAVRDGDVAAIPEPETYSILMTGLLVIGAVVRRKRSA